MRNKELNFNSPEEEESVALIFKQAMECLKEEDRELQFIDSLLPLLKRGIGVHHSGLLPILKEVIELLFQEQLIKVCLTRTEKNSYMHEVSWLQPLESIAPPRVCLAPLKG